MKRLFATAAMAGAFAAGCSSPSHEAAPIERAPAVSASPTATPPELKNPYCDPTFDPAYKPRKNFLAISSHIGDLMIIYEGDCDTQIWHPDEYGNPINGTRCTPKGHLARLDALPKNPELRDELKNVIQLLKDSELCTEYVIDPVPVGTPDSQRP